MEQETRFKAMPITDIRAKFLELAIMEFYLFQEILAYFKCRMISEITH